MSGSDAVTLTLADEAATLAFGAALAGLLQSGDILFLDGPLGIGKSALARAAIRARAGDPDLRVPSPSFSLIERYALPGLRIAHIDLFRIEQPEELAELGLDELFAEGAALIEWPERLGPHAPADALCLTLSPGDTPDARRLTIAAIGSPRLTPEQMTAAWLRPA